MKIFSLCLLASVLSAGAQECNPQDAAQALAENESKFVQSVQDQGPRAAFLTFLADDGIMFDPGPVNAKKNWIGRPDEGPALKWQPVFVAVARSCDLGFTTGPSEARRKKDDEKPLGYGQSVTIWKKQADGAWKVAVDTGTGTPGAQKVEEPPELSVAATEAAPAKVDLAAAKRKLRDAEAWFTETAKTDSTAALVGSSSRLVRVMRDRVYPAVGREPAGLMLSVRRGAMTTERLGGDMSQAGDLAYSYGKYSVVRSQDSERGYYLQIWRTEEKGAWKLALDLQSPLPAEQKKASQ